tara:strand:- start:641 stop:3586 length:2946 start_codon:yes stop_codon:yes gene_type:complete
LRSENLLDSTSDHIESLAQKTFGNGLNAGKIVLMQRVIKDQKTMGKVFMNKKVLSLIGALLFIAGCKQGSAPEENASAVEAASTSLCQSKVTDISAEDAKILAEAGATPEQIVSYSLDANGIDCSTNQAVSWKTLGSTAETLDQNNTQLVSVYKKPGTYVVTAQIQTTGSTSVVEVSQKTVIANGLAITGPDVSTINTDNTFSLVNVLGSGAESASWDFGDGSAPVSGLGPVNHTYTTPGTYNIVVTVLLGDGSTLTLNSTIQVVDGSGNNDCLAQLSVSGPSEATVNQPVSLSTFIPACLTLEIGSVVWDFGDGSAPAFNQNVDHTYAAIGDYMVIVTLYRVGDPAPFVTLTHGIHVIEDNGGGPIDPTPHLCPVEGETRQVIGGIVSEEVACGVNGSKINSYRQTVTESCQLVGEIRQWVEVSTSRELTNEGECQGQSCEVQAADMNELDPSQLGLQLISGKYYLNDGSSLTFFSSQTPNGTCGSVSYSKSCSNGTLSGNSSAVYLTCHEGCSGFGPHGSTQIGVTTGTESVGKECSFGETGVYDIFNVISDQMCTDGQVVTSNARRGSLKTAGLCPTYNWVETENYTECSAACGGEQQMIHECRDNSGNVAPKERCTTPEPVVTRLCDGDPESVARQEVEKEIEDGSETKMCPKNEIGKVFTQREVTTTRSYACIDHKVALASEEKTYGEWTEIKHCKQYVAYRCSGDSLSKGAALGRYHWMQKCRKEVKAIDEFLEEFDSFAGTYRGLETLVFKNKEVYPTFAYSRKGREYHWKAPMNPGSSCWVPENLFVAAVCTASCATPEQKILTATSASERDWEYRSFLDNWQEDVKYVATMSNQKNMESKHMTLTKVNQWITELYDTENEVLTFETQSGGTLTVTTNHPILTEEGSMKLASDFKEGEFLVRHGGLLDQIVSITPSVHVGKVYNLYVESSDPKSNVVSTNGFLNGTAFFQNEGSEMMNHEVLRKQLTRGAFDE